MRTYIFTKAERSAIKQFIKERKRNAVVNNILAHFDEKWAKLLIDFKLLIALKRLWDEGY
jgi:hypothetical protein